MLETVWIAREPDTNRLYTFKTKPIFDRWSGWEEENHNNADSGELPKSFFPKVTFENSPKELILKL